MYTEILYCRNCQLHTAHVHGKCDTCAEAEQRWRRLNRPVPREKIKNLRPYENQH